MSLVNRRLLQSNKGLSTTYFSLLSENKHINIYHNCTKKVTIRKIALYVSSPFQRRKFIHLYPIRCVRSSVHSRTNNFYSLSDCELHSDLRACADAVPDGYEHWAVTKITPES